MKPLSALNLAQFENYLAMGCQVIDMRPAEQFAEEYNPGAIYGAENFIKSGGLGKLIPVLTPIVLIAEEGKEQEKCEILRKAGFENIEGYLKEGFATWLNAGNTIDVALSIDPEEIMLDIKFGDPKIVDLRSKTAYNFMHLASADNVQASKLINHMEALPKDDVFYLYDEDGETALSIISWLKKHGHHNYYHIKGGYKALQESEASMASQDKPDKDAITKLPPEQLN